MQNSNSQPQYRRRTILINPPFQLKFIFYVTSWLIALSVFYPIIIYQLYNYFAQYLGSDPLGPPIQLIESTRNDVVLLLIGLQVIFTVVVALISLFLSHRIAGPLYKLKKTFHEVASGNRVTHLRFRKGDHFPDLAESFNEMMSKLPAGAGSPKKELKEAMAILEKDLSRNDSTEVRKALDLLKRV